MRKSILFILLFSSSILYGGPNAYLTVQNCYQTIVVDNDNRDPNVPIVLIGDDFRGRTLQFSTTNQYGVGIDLVKATYTVGGTSVIVDKYLNINHVWDTESDFVTFDPFTICVRYVSFDQVTQIASYTWSQPYVVQFKYLNELISIDNPSTEGCFKFNPFSINPMLNIEGLCASQIDYKLKYLGANVPGFQTNDVINVGGAVNSTIGVAQGSSFCGPIAYANGQAIIDVGNDNIPRNRCLDFTLEIELFACIHGDPILCPPMKVELPITLCCGCGSGIDTSGSSSGSGNTSNKGPREESLNDQGLVILPNPSFSGQFNIKGVQTNTEISLFNSVGKRVFQSVKKSSGDVYRINTKLSSGIYFMIINNNGIINKRKLSIW